MTVSKFKPTTNFNISVVFLEVEEEQAKCNPVKSVAVEFLAAVY